MAKSMKQAEQELEGFCKSAYTKAREQGNYHLADSIHDEFIYLRESLMKGYPVNYDNLKQRFESQEYTERQAAMAQQAQNMGINNAMGIAAIPSQYMQTASNTQVKGVTPPKFGVLIMNGAELSPDWRGAEITSVSREVLTTYKCWLVRFISKWSSEQVQLYLSLDEHSGNEADKMAETFKEILNQRRVG